MDLGLKKKRVLVQGASSGLGFAIAKLNSKHGQQRVNSVHDFVLEKAIMKKQVVPTQNVLHLIKQVYCLRVVL